MNLQMRKIGIMDDSQDFLPNWKDIFAIEMKKTVSEADLGRETRVQFWTCYF